MSGNRRAAWYVCSTVASACTRTRGAARQHRTKRSAQACSTDACGHGVAQGLAPDRPGPRASRGQRRHPHGLRPRLLGRHRGAHRAGRAALGRARPDRQRRRRPARRRGRPPQRPGQPARRVLRLRHRPRLGRRRPRRRRLVPRRRDARTCRSSRSRSPRSRCSSRTSGPGPRRSATTPSGGLMERAERMVLLGIGLAFDILVPVLWMMLVLTRSPRCSGSSRCGARRRTCPARPRLFEPRAPARRAARRAARDDRVPMLARWREQRRPDARREARRQARAARRSRP